MAKNAGVAGVPVSGTMYRLHDHRAPHEDRMSWQSTDRGFGGWLHPEPPVAPVPGTLNQLFRMASLAEARPAALLRVGAGGWRPLSDARLARRVEWLAHYLSAVFEVRPGDQVAIASDLRQEWLLADLAIMSLGATSVAIEPDLPAAMLLHSIQATEPRILFASGDVLGRLRMIRSHVPPLIPVIAFDSPHRWGGPIPLAAALDAGSVHGVGRRSGELRKSAWNVAPEAAACCHYAGYQDGHVECVELTHAEAFARVVGGWIRPLSRAGERVYVAGPRVTLRTRLAMYAALGDGYSVLVLGTPGHEREEIRELRPGKIIAPPALLEGLVWGPPASHGEGRIGDLGALVRATLRRVMTGRGRADQHGLRKALGGRIRWVASTEIMEPELSARLSSIAVVGPSFAASGTARRMPGD